MQLPAELADEVDPQRVRLGDADIDELAGEPGEGGVGEIGIGELLKELARTRAGQHQHAILGGDLFEPDAARGGQRLFEIVIVMALEGPGADQVEAVAAGAVDGELRADAAVLRQQVTKRDPPLLLRYAVGKKAVKPGLGSRTRDQIFGEGRHVEQADIVMDVAALLPTWGK